jgi:hypothetical protein
MRPKKKKDKKRVISNPACKYPFRIDPETRRTFRNEERRDLEISQTFHPIREGAFLLFISSQNFNSSRKTKRFEF